MAGKLLEIEDLTAEKSSELAKDIVAGRVFCSFMLRSHELDCFSMVFLPVALGAFAEYDREELKKIGFMYGYYEDSMPRSINGLPCFSKVLCVNTTTADIVLAKVKKLQELMDTV